MHYQVNHLTGGNASPVAAAAVASPFLTSSRCGGSLLGILSCVLLLAQIFIFSPAGVTLASGGDWGQNATLAPGWERIKQAAWNAVSAPETWVPAAASLAFGVNNYDRKVQSWAMKKTPLFGSVQNADEMSDALWSASSAIWIGTGIAAPGGSDPGAWLVNKAQGFGLESGAGLALRSYVGYRKKSVGQASPNGADREGYLSVHGAGSAFYTTLASRHMEAFDLPGGAMTATRIGLGTLAVATSWARVEADQHYPSDVLKSMALGHLMGAFISDAFVEPIAGGNTTIFFEPTKAGMLAMVLLAF